MSSNDGDAGAPRPDRASRKPPLTIDLEASREGEALRKPAEDTARVEAASSAAASASMDPPPPQPNNSPEPAPAEANTLKLALVALAGGVAALLLFIILQSAGMLPAPRDAAAVSAANLATALKREVEGLQSAQGRDATADRALADRLAKVETAIAELEKRTGELGARLDARPATAPVPGTDPALGDRVAELARRIAALERTASTAQPSAELEPLRRQLAELAARVDQLASRPPPASDRAAYAMALGAVRQAAARGAPFANELALLRPLLREAASIDALGAAATKGVRSREALVAEFPKVADAVLAAVAPPPTGSWLERMAGHARSLVTVRPSGPVAGTDPDAIVSRMRAKVAAGDLAGGLEERGSLPDPGKTASADWAGEVSARLDLDRRLEVLARSGPAGTAAE